MNTFVDIKFEKAVVKGERDQYYPSWEDKGFLYLIKNGYKVKVGSSRGPIMRIRTLLAAAGITECEIYISNRIKFYKKIEKHIHFELKEKRAIGEWFYVTTDEIFDKFCRIKVNHSRNMIQYIETIAIENLTVDQGASK